MRVIAGVARGHKLKVIEGLSVRPTTDRIKETLFNIISSKLFNVNFLDIFSGSGAIGIEALSRGALKSTFIENNPMCIDIIKENLNHTKLFDKSEVIKNDAISAIKNLAIKNEVFDVIFLDPPYNENLIKPVLLEILNGEILSENGIIIVEHSSEVSLPPLDGINLYRQKNFKTTTMSFISLEGLD